MVRIFMNGQKQTVVEREQNILSSEEAQQNEKACTQAMYDELMRCHTLGAFKRMPRKLAANVNDARWVLKVKLVAGKRSIQARLVVRGFKALLATQLSTFAGTTSRLGQRIVNSVAVQRGWQLFTADVSQAFLRGLTFKEAAQAAALRTRCALKSRPARTPSEGMYGALVVYCSCRPTRPHPLPRPTLARLIG